MLEPSTHRHATARSIQGRDPASSLVGDSRTPDITYYWIRIKKELLVVKDTVSSTLRLALCCRQDAVTDIAVSWM